MNYLELDWKCGDFIESDAERNEERYHATAVHDGIDYAGIVTIFINPRTFEREIIKVDNVYEDLFNRLANIIKPHTT